MKRAAMIATVVLLTVVGLSGCNFFFSLILDADLTVESVQVLESAGDITGFRITFGNYGGGADGVPFAVVLSDDTVVSPTAGDFVIYEGWFDIDWNTSQQVDVSREEINTYLGGSAGGYVPAGEFYVGVFVDHIKEIDEGDETDNESTTSESYYFGGGGSYDWDADYEAFGTYNSYVARTIASYGTQLLKFSPNVSGNYTIGLSSMSSGADLGFVLLDDPDLDYFYENPASYLVSVDDHSDNSSESAIVSLTQGTTYYMVIDEWADPGSEVSYDLSIFQPN